MQNVGYPTRRRSEQCLSLFSRTFSTMYHQLARTSSVALLSFASAFRALLLSALPRVLPLALGLGRCLLSGCGSDIASHPRESHVRRRWWGHHICWRSGRHHGLPDGGRRLALCSRRRIRSTRRVVPPCFAPPRAPAPSPPPVVLRFRWSATRARWNFLVLRAWSGS